MTTTPKTDPATPHEPSRIWTIAVPPPLATRIGVSLVHVLATQMGEVIVSLIDTAGGVGLLVYAADEPHKLAETKAVCDRFSLSLWPLVLEWRERWARTPWSYIGASKPRRMLRDRYWRGTDPGTLMRPVAVEPDETIAPLDVDAIRAGIDAALTLTPPEPPPPEPDFWDGPVAHFDRARRADIAAFKVARPDVGVVAWSRFGAADERSFQAAKARAEAKA